MIYIEIGDMMFNANDGGGGGSVEGKEKIVQSRKRLRQVVRVGLE